MKLIAKNQGGDTDSLRDHDSANWDDLKHVVEKFVAATRLQLE